VRYFAHGRGVLGTDHRPHEVLGASLLGTSVPVWIFILWSWSGLHRTGVAPDIEKGLGVPIEITPVIDMESPLMKKGAKVQLPKEWQVQEPQVSGTDKAASVSTSAPDDPDAIPEPGLEVVDGGEVPDPDASDAAAGDPGDASAGQGGGSPEGADGGMRERDPEEERAARLYRGRITAFLRAGFVCPQLPEGAPRCSPSASVTIAGDLTVTSVSFSPCGVPEIDSAAGGSINSKKGQAIPPPPESYPHLQPSAFAVSYVCK
jgi:hypothetical protein